MKTIQFYVTGEPRPQLRPRAFMNPYGQARVYNPKTAEGWKSQIAEAAQKFIPVQPFSGPVCLELTFYFPRPKGHFGTGKNEGKLKENAPNWHTVKPDRDNLDKPFLDCLTTLGIFRDDSQVCDGVIKKLYCPPGLQPGCNVVLIALDEPERVPEAQNEMNALLV